MELKSIFHLWFDTFLFGSSTVCSDSLLYETLLMNFGFVVVVMRRWRKPIPSKPTTVTTTPTRKLRKRYVQNNIHGGNCAAVLIDERNKEKNGKCNMMFKSFFEKVLRIPYVSQSLCIRVLFVCSIFYSFTTFLQLVPVFILSPSEPGGANGAGLQGGPGSSRAPDPAAPTPPAFPLPTPQRHVPDPGGRGGRVLQRLRCQHPAPSAGHGAGVPQETGRRRCTSSPPASSWREIWENKGLSVRFIQHVMTCLHYIINPKSECPEPNHRIGIQGFFSGTPGHLQNFVRLLWAPHV